MPFQKGNKLAVGIGRPKGPAESTKKWEAFVEFCANAGLEKLQTELMKLEGKQFVDAFAMLLEFYRPKLARTEVVGDPEQPVNHTITFLVKNERNEEVKKITIGTPESNITDAEVINEKDNGTTDNSIDNRDSI